MPTEILVKEKDTKPSSPTRRGQRDINIIMSDFVMKTKIKGNNNPTVYGTQLVQRVRSTDDYIILFS